jgi:phenylacetate-CoA ligase
MLVEAELHPDFFTDDYPQLKTLQHKIARELSDEILFTPLVKLVPPGSLPKTEGKAVRVKDNRKG